MLIHPSTRYIPSRTIQRQRRAVDRVLERLQQQFSEPFPPMTRGYAKRRYMAGTLRLQVCQPMLPLRRGVSRDATEYGFGAIL